MSLSQKMITYWTNFAARDEPNQAEPGSQAPTGLPPWPNFTARTRPLLALTDEPKATTAFRSDHRCVLWDRVNPEGLY
jgi:carboxylesterase type B